MGIHQVLMADGPYQAGPDITSMMQGVQILRVHDVNDIIQSVKVFKKLIKS